MEKQIPVLIMANEGSNIRTDEFSIEYEDMLVLSNISNEKIPLLSLPFHIKRLLAVAMLVSLVIGSYYKSIMYSYVCTANRKNRCWMHRPINILIVTSAVIHHLTHLWVGIALGMILIMDLSMADAVSERFCQMTYIVGDYGLMYLSVGSFGISLYRMIYIKCEHWIKNVIGEKRLLGIILVLSLLFCGLMVCFEYLETHNERVFLNVCYGSSSSDTQTMIDYELSRGAQLLTTTALRKVTIIVLISLQVIELGIYVWFFYTRYKNDNGKIKDLLTQENIKDRNIQNVTTFVGQFYGFIVEYVFLIICLIWTYLKNDGSDHWKAYFIIMKFIDFGLLSAVEVYSSPILKKFMKMN